MAATYASSAHGESIDPGAAQSAASCRAASRVVAVLALFGSLNAMPAWAETRPLGLLVSPPDAQLLEAGKPVATAQGTGRNELSLEVETAAEHYFAVHREGFDDLALRLRWDAGLQAWERLEAPSPVRVYLARSPEREEIRLSKTFRLATSPDFEHAYVEVLRGQPSTMHTSIYGAEHYWRELVRQPDGRIVLPRACGRQMVLLTRRWFSDYPLTIEKDALLGVGGSYPSQPVALSPLYGPFSYRWFDVTLGVVGVLALAAWQLYVVPRRRARREEIERKLQLADDVGGSATLTSQQTRVGATVMTDSGEGFVLLHELGRGATGVVFEACSDGTMRSADERWAVKVLSRGAQDETILARFKREVAVCSRLTHPGLVKVLDAGTHKPDPQGDELPFLVMEKVEGTTLGRLIEEAKGPLELAVALGYLESLLNAMRVAHEAGVVHRDLKPDNIMVTRAQRTKILDFGMAHAKDTGRSITQSGIAMGTPRYMSPEHLDAKRVTPAADVFSIGIIAYEMLGGGRPFEGDDVWELIAKVATQDAQPLCERCPQVPEDLSAFVARMMHRDLRERFANAGEALAVLEDRFEAWSSPE